MKLTKELLASVLAIAEQAGEKILTVYQRSDIGLVEKKDGSPLTEADMLAHHHIKDALAELTPTIPVLSEESTESEIADRKNWSVFWLVDPLDGTKEFVNKTDEFTVNIALIINHEAVLGAVVAPALGASYFAMQGFGAFKKNGGQTQTIKAQMPGKVTRVVASRRHGSDALEKFLHQVGEHELVQAGSALKICLVAEGVADMYPRLGPTCEWDTAAGQAVISEAQGKLYDSQGRDFRYNCRDTLLNGSFIVSHEALDCFPF
jgi:3'(2'), 5'-bisphosphate nucleotidase